MNTLKRSKKFYFMLAVFLLSISSILCGAALIGVSVNIPLGTKLNLPIGYAVQLIPNQNGGYFMVQNYDTQTHIVLLDSRGNVLQQQIFNTNFQSVCTSKDALYVLLEDETASYNESTMVIYNLAATNITNYQITTLDTNLKTVTASQNGTIYGIGYQDDQTLFAYSHLVDNGISTAVPLKTFAHTLQSLCISPNDQLYIGADNSDEFYIANAAQGLPYQFSTGTSSEYYPSLPPHTLTNDLLLDTNQQLYRIHSDSTPLFSPLSDSLYTSACALPNGSILVSPTNKTELQELSLTGTVLNRYQLEGTCTAIATNQNETGILFVQQDALYFVTLTELIYNIDSSNSSTVSSMPTISVPAESDDNDDNLSNPDSSSSSNVSSDNNSDNSSNIHPDQLVSDRFDIDRGNDIIILPPSTTFSVLRNSLNSTKDTIIVKNLSRTTISSGNLGTGYTVSLQINGSIVDTLTIIVKGDLNGTGTVNSRDVLLLYNYLNQSEPLTQIEFFAGDLNSDDMVDTSDLLILKQQIAASQ